MRTLTLCQCNAEKIGETVWDSSRQWSTPSAFLYIRALLKLMKSPLTHATYRCIIPKVECNRSLCFNEAMSIRIQIVQEQNQRETYTMSKLLYILSRGRLSLSGSCTDLCAT